MSHSQTAFLNRADVPDRQALQAAIDRLGFKLILHPDWTPFEDSGFSPCILEGAPDVGFEVRYAPASEAIEEYPDFAAIAGGRDFSINMTWGASLQDGACALIASCALAKDFGAIVSYEGEPPESAEALFEGAQELLGLVREEQSKATSRQTRAPDPDHDKPRRVSGD